MILSRPREIQEGARFGRFVVLSKGESDWRNRARYLCLCDCGLRVLVASYVLLSAPSSPGRCCRLRRKAGLPSSASGR